MNSLNKVMLIGNLTRDPEIRQTPKGVSVTDIGIAINRVYTTDSGEKQEDVTFVDVTLWDRLAENAGKYLNKGQPVFIEGRLKLDSWEDKDSGQNRHRLRVVAERMQFLGGGKRDESEPELEDGSSGGASGDSPGQKGSKASKASKASKGRQATFA